MYTQFVQLSLCLGAVFATAAQAATVKCNDGYTFCSPSDATSAITPQIGDPSFANLFVNMVQSHLPNSSRKRSLGHAPRSVGSLCCNAQLSCLNMASVNIPFCYDKFTTNFLLPDGSTGSVVGGTYKSPGGDVANLESGDYTKANGQTGNIYTADMALKPNTAALPMPTQYTASGVGSAIPIQSLGTYIILTYTTTIPGSTIPASTYPPVTLTASASTVTVLLPTSTTVIGVSGTVTSTTVSQGVVTSYSIVNVAPSTIQGSTRSGSTFAAVTTTITTSTYSMLPTASTTKKSGGTVVVVSLGGVWIGMLAQLFL